MKILWGFLLGMKWWWAHTETRYTTLYRNCYGFEDNEGETTTIIQKWGQMLCFFSTGKNHTQFSPENLWPILSLLRATQGVELNDTPLNHHKCWLPSRWDVIAVIILTIIITILTITIIITIITITIIITILTTIITILTILTITIMIIIVIIFGRSIYLFVLLKKIKKSVIDGNVCLYIHMYIHIYHHHHHHHHRHHHHDWNCKRAGATRSREYKKNKLFNEQPLQHGGFHHVSWYNKSSCFLKTHW